MMTLSIRQPWAWLILNAGKDIENRNWPTAYRGRFLIHAGKGMTREEYENAAGLLYEINPKIELPTFERLDRGGVVGSVELVDCVRQSKSLWFFGDYGFVLRAPAPMVFEACKGRLGFFDIPRCDGCGAINGFHEVTCMADSEPPPFGAMHS